MGFLDVGTRNPQKHKEYKKVRNEIRKQTRLIIKKEQCEVGKQCKYNPRQDKVDVVRASTATTPSHDVRWHDTKTLSNWSTVTADEVAKLIGVAPCKTCSLDPIPTWFVKEMRGLLSPLNFASVPEIFIYWPVPDRI